MEGLQGFMSDLGAAYKEQKRKERSNDIIEFIRANWRFFAPSRAAMNAAYSQLGQNGIPFTVDGLCNQLGIPTNIYFKRSPVADIGGTLLDFEASKLFELFKSCLKHHREACMFVVAGKKSVCITNMQQHFETVRYDFRYWDGDLEVHVFKATEAAERLPNLFNPKENSYE